MNISQRLFQLSTRQWLSVALLTIVTTVIGLDIMLLQTPEYRSDFSLLVIEKDATLDGYAAAKSAERLSLSLANVMYTTAFFADVMQSGLVSPDVSFPADAEIRRRDWKHTIETRVSPDVGVIHVAVYHPDQTLATNLAFALSQVMIDSGPEYLGGGNTVVLRVADSPTTSRRPVRPDFVFGMIAGALLGLVGSLGFYLVPIRRSDRQSASPTAPLRQHLSLLD